MPSVDVISWRTTECFMPSVDVISWRTTDCFMPSVDVISWRTTDYFMSSVDVISCRTTDCFMPSVDGISSVLVRRTKSLFDHCLPTFRWDYCKRCVGHWLGWFGIELFLNVYRILLQYDSYPTNATNTWVRFPLPNSCFYPGSETPHSERYWANWLAKLACTKHAPRFPP